MSSRPSEKHVWLKSDGLSLEGVLTYPAGSGPFPAAVVCQPHPLYGGNMNNNVVMAIHYALVGRGIAALRFNFRGVGASEGRFADGVGEQNDVRAAFDFLAADDAIDRDRLALTGYSFGAGVAAVVAPSDARVKVFAAVAPPLASVAAEAFQAFSGGKLIVVGDRDDFSSAPALQTVIGMLSEPKRLLVVPGVDHFWWGAERIAADAVADFVAQALGVGASGG